MNLGEFVTTDSELRPWAEGEKIPWDDPAFSARMLKEHLSQQHNAASRRSEKIDAHVDWIHQHILNAQRSDVLDLCCGPGLYAQRLTRLGHQCAGIDFGPASIDYARHEAEKHGLSIAYTHADIREADYGSDRDLVMLIFGEFNVFHPSDARQILTRAFDVLKPGGRLLLEPHTFEIIRKMGQDPPTWYSQVDGLFSARPHICLEEAAWDEETQTTTTRYSILDAETATIGHHGSTMQAYTDAGYRALLAECGFENVVFYPSLMGIEDASQKGLFGIVGVRPQAGLQNGTE